MSRAETRSTGPKLVRIIAIASLLLYAASIVATAILETKIERDAAVGLWTLTPTGVLAVFGALIMWRHPENTIGRIFSAVALLWAVGSFADGWATYTLTVPGRLLAGGRLAAWVGEWYWIPYLCMSFVALPLLFPTGRASSLRWRLFGRVALGAVVAVTVAAALDPHLDLAGSKVTVANPIGLPIGADPDDGGWPALLLALTIAGGGPAAIASLFMRFRGSQGIERQQLKWFLFGSAVFLGGFILLGLTDAIGWGRPPGWVEGAVFSLLPAAGAMAILRYRLYDIDLIINRTLVYALLSAVLAGAYVGLVVLFQGVLSAATNESDVAVAASTLGVAAMFGPARRRVQSFIDRRFYRSRYDAHETLESFAAQLRDEVDLDHLSSELVGIVATTMRPRHASLWLRPTEGGRA